jgi:hypothetical protein
VENLRFYTDLYGVSKRALHIWKSTKIYTEDIHNVLNGHNVAKHCKFASTQYWLRHRERHRSWDLDMLQQFLIPQLDDDDQEGRILLQQDAHPLITMKKCASTSTPVSQVGWLVERRL